MRRNISFFIIIAMLLTYLPFTNPCKASADIGVDVDEEYGVVFTEMGFCGSTSLTFMDIFWRYGEGLLVISGEGPMKNFQDDDPLNYAPWYEFAGDIKRVIIKDGITKIGEDAFSAPEGVYYNLEEFIIPSTLTEISNNAFSHVKTIAASNEEAELIIPENVSAMGEYAFSNLDYVRCIKVQGAVNKIYKGTLQAKAAEYIDIAEGCKIIVGGGIPDDFKVLFLPSTIEYYTSTGLLSELSVVYGKNDYTKEVVEKLGATYVDATKEYAFGDDTFINVTDASKSEFEVIQRIDGVDIPLYDEANFETEYGYNEESGKATITIKGLKCYTGEKTIEYDKPEESETPSVEPSESVVPSVEPSESTNPSANPSASVVPSIAPSESTSPSVEPSESTNPSTNPSASVVPSISPSESASPSVEPSGEPSASVSPGKSSEPIESENPRVAPTTSVDPGATVTPSESVEPAESPVTVSFSLKDTGKEKIKITIKANNIKYGKSPEYLIYRAKKKGGKYSIIVTTSKNIYTDSSVKPGNTYYYKIKVKGQDTFSKIKDKYLALLTPKFKLKKKVSGAGVKYLELTAKKWSGNRISIKAKIGKGSYKKVNLKNNIIGKKKNKYYISYSFKNTMVYLKIYTYKKKNANVKSKAVVKKIKC
ncbi:MAG: leucine-rich repeat protein [Lachnospiraceae bacterium]|nr:leucine-rich repeat protein [Lachnospiraceae bacterium]